ncbi:MAG: transglutaminase family protein [Rhodospirillales bacterium]|nr:transglutaminase family protein [Alphaproteobacteria bacterium]MBL6928801.1 transglutaminase family protein [Rhodospirillales bacterium]
MRLPAKFRKKLSALGALADDEIDLAEAALLLACAGRPRANLEPYRRHLEKIAVEVGAYADSARGPGDLADQVEALSHVFARRYGYGCEEETFEDLEAANLMRVIDSRRGLPVALGILHLHVAHTLGWNMVGLDFPSRFLIRMEQDGVRAVLDPADGCRILEPADLRAILKQAEGMDAELTPGGYAPMTRRAILFRLQNNIKVRKIRNGNMKEALETIETIALFAPQASDPWRESGIINARLGNCPAAIAALEEYLKFDDTPANRREAQALLQEMKRRIN